MPALSAFSVGSLKASQINQTDGYAVGTCRDRRIHRIYHIRSNRLLRAGPLIGTAEKCAGILGSVLGGDKERVRCDVIYENEFPLWMLREKAEAFFRGLCTFRYSETERG